MPDIEDGVKFSEFPSATPGNADVVVGLHDGDNAKFTVANLVLAIRQGLENIFIPKTRTVNGKALSSDITLTASDVEAQDEITATGILKGDGAGGVSAAVAGTDYGTYSKPSEGIPASDLANGVIPTVPSISTSTPQMDSTGAAGSTGEVSDAGHVHPSDTSKANQDQLAYVESGSTASRAYAVGEYFCWGGTLYRAKTAISSGAAFTVGTNCEAVTGGLANGISVKHIDITATPSSVGNVQINSNTNGVVTYNNFVNAFVIDNTGATILTRPYTYSNLVYVNITNLAGSYITTQVKIRVYYLG